MPEISVVDTKSNSPQRHREHREELNYVLCALRVFVVSFCLFLLSSQSLRAQGIYRIQPQDTLDGRISFPLVGELPVSGKTAGQVSEEVRRRLLRYIRAPEVTVEVLRIQKRPVRVLGAVRTPGSYVLESGDTLLDIVYRAGGALPSADLDQVKVIKEDGESFGVNLGSLLQGKSLDQNVRLSPGDTVYFPYLPLPGRSVTLLGYVTKPGVYEIVEGKNLLEVLLEAGGLREGADGRRTVVHRGGRQIPVDAEAILAGNLSGNIPILPGDVVMVPERKDQIIILGEVTRPGLYPLRGGETVLELIGRAGGITSKGLQRDIQVVRGDPGAPELVKVNLDKLVKERDLAQNVVLQPGDIVYIPARGDVVFIERLLNIILAIRRGIVW
ncbi:MAG: SLBB domain-containing protein [Armatimonadetes bacterium]|nr:SLBB domain-containing protein [Armatimonadota bacterium]